MSERNRKSSATVGMYWNAPSIVPSGNIDSQDRQHIAWSYTGIPTAAPPDIRRIRMPRLAPKLNRKFTTIFGPDALSLIDTMDIISDVTAGTQEANKVISPDENEEIDGLGITRVTDTRIGSGDVLALNATPIVVIPAPGAGVYTEFLGAYILLDYASIAYVDGAGEDLVFKYTDASGVEVSMEADGDLFDGTDDALVWVPPIGSSGAVGAVEMVSNAQVVLHLLTGEWTAGNSPLKIRAYHRQVRLSSMESIA